MSKKSLIAGTLILTIASFITRLLGFGFRIYQSQVMGAEGMGLYQLLFPIYMLLWATSSAGIALAIAKMIAAEVSKGEEGNAVHILKVSLLISLPLSFILSILLFLFAPFIARYYIHEPVTELSLRILAFCVPFMSTACCLRGYFQGHQEMSITALAQIVEQVARMTAIYLLAHILIPMGTKYVCALGVIGMCTGEVFSFIMSFIAYQLKKRKVTLGPVTLKHSQTFNQLLALSIPITANRFLTSGLSSFENILIPINLEKFGLTSHEALALYGKFSGMALPLLLFPSMVTSSLATALVPAISEAVAMKKQAVLQNTIGRAIQFSALIGIGATSLFLSFSEDIAMACYHIKDVGYLLKWLAVICPFIYLQNILTGTMNGLGMQKRTFQTNIIGSLFCIGTILLVVPLKGIIGFVLAMLFQSGFVCCRLLIYVLEFVDLKVDLNHWILKPSIAAIISAFISITFKHYLFSPYLGLVLSTTFSLLTLAGTYLICLILVGSLSIKDIKAYIGTR
ncbi:MAG: polysaccharide biosynthesis protein [Cellulosilyticum sp.]|nr:polysaccharide biosynthesis protein [Cellulosilyticum sp.]